MKKIISAFLSLAIIIGTFPIISAFAGTATEQGWDGETEATDLSGTGTAADPYLISTPSELAYARTMINKHSTNGKIHTSDTKDAYLSCFKLTADIDLNGKEWTPIGSTNEGDKRFDGVFDGNGKVIKNFKITQRTADNNVRIGFFAHVGMWNAPATIKNLGIENGTVNILAAVDKAAVMVGRGVGTFTDCYVKNSKVTGDATVGGFIGDVRYASEFNRCYVYNTEVSCTASRERAAAGFAGNIEVNLGSGIKYKFNNCYTANIINNGSRPFYPLIYCSKPESMYDVKNCISNVVGKNGYKTEMSLGTVGVTKAGFVSALENVGYSVTGSVNDGYPCLKNECVWDGVSTETYTGEGSVDKPYEISNPNQLAYARDRINDYTANKKHFKLTADIDLGGKEWLPMGLVANSGFMGTFDGNGHVIKNFKISSSSTAQYSGLFGHMDNDAAILNLGISGATVEKGGSAGIMIGRGKATVKNCYVKNSILKGTGNPGLFVGSVRKTSTFENCYVYNCEVNAPSAVINGFAGQFENYGETYTFKNCYTAEMKNNATSGAFYPFANIEWPTTKYNDKTFTYNLTNVMSSENGAGTRYKSTLAKGDEGKTKVQIQQAMPSGAYKTDSFINGGYPSLNFEKNAEYPYTITAVTAYDKVRVSVKENTAVSGASVYIASYNAGGRLIDADTFAAKDGTFETSGNLNNKAAYVKVFVWNSDLTPIAEPYRATVERNGSLKEYFTADDEDTQPERKTRIVMMGDSIMDSVHNEGCSYATKGEQWQKRGWEGYIANYFNDDVEIIKHGHNGQTIKNFIDGRQWDHYCSWETIKDQVGYGDYIILGLGTNDNTKLQNYNNRNTLYVDDTGDFSQEKYDAAYKSCNVFSPEEFKTWYKKIITEAKAKGVTVILTTPIPGDIHYNSSTGKFKGGNDVWPISNPLIREVISETEVEYVDLSTLYADALSKLISDGIYTAAQLRVEYQNNEPKNPGVVFVDSVHPSAYGADLIAKTFVTQIKTMDTGLENYVK